MIVAGIGFRADAPAASMAEALDAARHAAGSGCSIDALATLPHKAATLAAAQDLPVVTIAAEALAGIATPTRSPRILARFGTGSLAEALALVAAGPGARLIAHRHASPDGMATAAIAQSATSNDAQSATSNAATPNAERPLP